MVLECPGGIISYCKTNCEMSKIPVSQSKIQKSEEVEGSAEFPILESRSSVIRFDEYESEEITSLPAISESEESGNLENVEVILERSDERTCKVIAVKPENFSMLGDVTVSILTAGCNLKKSSVKINGSPCQVI